MIILLPVLAALACLMGVMICMVKRRKVNSDAGNKVSDGTSDASNDFDIECRTITNALYSAGVLSHATNSEAANQDRSVTNGAYSSMSTTNMYTMFDGGLRLTQNATYESIQGNQADTDGTNNRTLANTTYASPENILSKSGAEDFSNRTLANTTYKPTDLMLPDSYRVPSYDFFSGDEKYRQDPTYATPEALSGTSAESDEPIIAETRLNANPMYMGSSDIDNPYR